MHWSIYFYCLCAMAVFGFAGWLLSLLRKNVTHVDSMWSLFFVVLALTNYHYVSAITFRTLLVISLVTVWALRLCIYLTWRNWGPHEDHRYAEIRKNNEPLFWLKSIYIIFGLQTILAWVVGLSIFAAINTITPMNKLDLMALNLVLFGLVWETVADWQLSRFKANPDNKGKVLNTGLWRYSRHPNYFGECCVWWGFYLFALAAGAWWAIISPVLMTILLLKVSGVSLLETTITERRPAYANYIKSTNAFFPGPSKKSAGEP